MTPVKEIRIVLASQSPRRRELMKQAGFSFEVHPAVGEERITSTHPAEVVEELSLQKALEVAGKEEPSGGGEVSLYVGADTVVAIDHRILGKPRDTEQAREMIRELQGRVHQVYTGVTLLLEGKGTGQRNIRTFHECTDVYVYPMSDEEIEHYISTDEPYDKAGAYGIQGAFGIYIEKIDGDYNNVVGLPIARLYHELTRLLS